MKETTLPTIEEISQEFTQNLSLYERLREEAKYTIEEELAKTNIKIHSIPSRIKSLDSFLGKITHFKITKPFERIEDIVGLRIICLFLTDIEKIGFLVRNCFTVIREDNKIDNSKFASFGYLSVHFIVKLGNNFKGPRYNKILEIPFEIQVRTIAMDAWANISHYLEYKTDEDIPKELKRDFYALSGMFYVADKHFQLFFEQRKENNKEIAEIIEKGKVDELNNQPINLDTLRIFLNEKLSTYSTSNDLSWVIEDLSLAGFKTIGELNKILNKGSEAAVCSLQDKINSKNKNSASISSENILMASIYLTDYNYYKIFLRRFEIVEIPDFNKWKTINKKYMDLIKN